MIVAFTTALCLSCNILQSPPLRLIAQAMADTPTFQLRLAAPADIPAISRLQGRAIAKLQRGFLTPEQIEASRAGMGLDTQIIDDGTYFCVEDTVCGALAGCGGWSRRATLYGGNHSGGRDARLLDPATEPARIRAMYTDPGYARRGVGRRVLAAAERAAAAEGFTSMVMAATAAGRPFYEACGYAVVEPFTDTNAAVPVPLFRMQRSL